MLSHILCISEQAQHSDTVGSGQALIRLQWHVGLDLDLVLDVEVVADSGNHTS